MQRFKSIYIAVLVSCAAPREDKITVPQLESGFYQEALGNITDQLRSDPDNEGLIDQKLYYCEQLDWPTTCISALDAYRDKHGMTSQLVMQYMTYYQIHERYSLLLALMDRWSKEYDLDEKFIEVYIDCLVRLGKKKLAIRELRNYLIDHQSLADLVFASDQYLKLGDTAMATYHLGKVYRLDPSNDHMWLYGKLLLVLGYTQKGFDLLDQLLAKNLLDDHQLVDYAHLLASHGQLEEARQILKPYAIVDTLSFVLADWYLADSQWDSAALLLKKMKTRDSTNREPIWKLGRLYEDRGWLYTSLDYFNYLLSLYPKDTLAAQRVDLIQRKIAYLQRLKFEEENSIPVKELEIKKIIINE